MRLFAYIPVAFSAERTTPLWRRVNIYALYAYIIIIYFLDIFQNVYDIKISYNKKNIIFMINILRSCVSDTNMMLTPVGNSIE